MLTLEAHLTYRCTLACQNCNRGCHLDQRHTADLTLAQLEQGARQIPGLERIVLIGGEPTLHPDVLELGRLALTLAPKVIIYSNAYTDQAKDSVGALHAMGIHNSGGTEKVNGSIKHVTNPFVAPVDFGITERQPCNWWAHRSCGYSLDAEGFTACSIGGMIDGILGLRVRTWFFKEADEAWRIKHLCRFCGAHFEPWPEGYEKDLLTIRGQVCSKTWANALTRDSQ